MKAKSKQFIVIFSILGGYLTFFFMEKMTNNTLHPICIFRYITHIPCAGCGMGRATLALLKGNVADSFRYNILCLPFTLAVMVAFCWVVMDMISGKNTFLPFISRDNPLSFKIILFGLIGMDWVINLIRL